MELLMHFEVSFLSKAFATCVTSPWLLLAVDQLMTAEVLCSYEFLATFLAAVFSFYHVFSETLSLYHLSAFSCLSTDLPHQVYAVIWESSVCIPTMPLEETRVT